MKFVASFLISLCFLSTSQSQIRFQGGLDNNTLVHFSVGMGVGNGVGIFAKTPKQRILYGFAAGSLVGLAKELHDTKKGNQYGQVHDIIATAVGGAVGGLIINWATRNDREHKKKEKLNKCRM